MFAQWVSQAAKCGAPIRHQKIRRAALGKDFYLKEYGRFVLRLGDMTPTIFIPRDIRSPRRFRHDSPAGIRDSHLVLG